MITSERLAEFLLSWTGAALVAAFLIVWRYRKRLWKARKYLPQLWKGLQWGVVLLGVLVWLWRAEYAHLVVSRAGMMLVVAGYWWLWNRRYRRAKGKTREVYYLPHGEDYKVKGETHAHRARLARAARARAADQSTNHAGHRQAPVSTPVEAEAGHE